ncbi:hypothetical protein [Vibrio vulnificus]|uniref:hypothetical protein n=1 Tax=Vibrio vulnificus TaxID=672 RepID=UPI0015934932|nr:hypothetical protein [Vibrio vulnificus]NVC72617.1 hypothetical protein [Vibrio vulnificus]
MKLNDETVARLKEAAFYGMNKTAMARYAGVHRNTLDAWFKEYPEINEQILTKRGDGDFEVAKALHEAAVEEKNQALLAHLSTKRLKNSEYNNDWGDGLDAKDENPQVNINLDRSELLEALNKELQG